MNEYIERLEQHQAFRPWRFDLRGYARYIEENHIPHDQIDEKIVAMFEK